MPILLGLILSGMSIYWASPVYRHKPDPVTGNVDVVADIGVSICTHVPGLQHYSSPPDWLYNTAGEPKDYWAERGYSRMTESSRHVMNQTAKRLACSEVWGGTAAWTVRWSYQAWTDGFTRPLSIPLQPEETFTTSPSAVTEQSPA